MAGHSRWPGAAGAAGMQLGCEDAWQESDRTEIAGTPARLGAGGPFGVCASVERGSRVDTRGRHARQPGGWRWGCIVGGADERQAFGWGVDGDRKYYNYN